MLTLLLLTGSPVLVAGGWEILENIMKNWQFALGQPVRMTLSGEKGSVVGRAEYSDRPDLYYVRYVAGDGCQVENWQEATAIEPDTIRDLED